MILFIEINPGKGNRDSKMDLISSLPDPKFPVGSNLAIMIEGKFHILNNINN